ncbi:hypothetical protein bthur0014_53670 [Bacillus thuringiensis IBL 4222]|nr:hypothetical protein bthur0010_58360 [Bacillus thuringiensis serovar pondicheriensis BGSC 4BA1]EEM99871.1 hypothetical protein bthur0014_53670 [Bacillus thuringiensis IBL 4222]
MVNDKLTEDLPITETTRHPYHDYYHSPDLVSLLIFDDGKNDETFDIHSRIRLGQFIRTFLGLDLSIHDLKDVVDELPQEIVTRGFELDVQGSDVNGLLSNWVCENKELIKSKKTFDSEYLNSIREAVLQALNEYITDEQVREVAFHLPTDILKLVEEFGNNGVEVLDYIYRWSNEHIELIESFKTK